MTAEYINPRAIVGSLTGGVILGKSKVIADRRVFVLDAPEG